MNNKITEQIVENPFWPAGETIDGVDQTVKIIPKTNDLLDVSQNYADWMKRVKSHYPELYKSQEAAVDNTSKKK
jgi:isocitrate/isopropylmalate dehydrogenase